MRMTTRKITKWKRRRTPIPEMEGSTAATFPVATRPTQRAGT